MVSFCTIFDSNYLDKGLALYRSLVKTTKDFRLYIFAFDDLAYDILTDMKLAHVVIISLAEFETEQMLKLKKERSKAEYCWTSTPVAIEYVLKKYNEESCTYIDADLYFFDSANLLLGEIENSGESVIITEHRFEKTPEGLAKIKKYGKYCVEFNTFKNDEFGLSVLKWWKEKCIEWCFYRYEENRFGDQKYLDQFTTLFKGVHELQNLGGGVAPWNIGQYKLSSVDDQAMTLKEINSNQEFKLVFYHFQNMRYLPFRLVNIKIGKADKKLKRAIYTPYLIEIEKIRKELAEKYQFNLNFQKSSSTNKVVAFIQKYIWQFKITELSDIFNLDRINKKK
jgi:hypothetical protein